jgi:glutathione S-transferase
MIRPCPKGGERWRPTVVALGGKAQFPFLVDPNTGRQLYESADIIAYLFETYGRRPVPLAWRLRVPNLAGSVAASAWRLRAGTQARPSRAPEKPLELYSLEASPFARRARETLCELELPYHLRNVGRTQAWEYIPPPVRDRLPLSLEPQSENRRAFQARAGRVMVPYLIDPNTGTELFESREIRRYLVDTYGVAAGTGDPGVGPAGEVAA